MKIIMARQVDGTSLQDPYPKPPIYCINKEVAELYTQGWTRGMGWSVEYVEIEVHET
jgi:hypothetical protein